MSLSRSMLCATGLALLFGAGCESPSPVSEHWGDAYHANNERMVANPDAGEEPADGVTAFEGTTVENALKQYRREQAKPTSYKAPGMILNQGGSKSK
jgi:hypothetical protein